MQGPSLGKLSVTFCDLAPGLFKIVFYMFFFNGFQRQLASNLLIFLAAKFQFLSSVEL